MMILSKLELELLKKIIEETYIDSNGLSNMIYKVDMEINDQDEIEKSREVDEILFVSFIRSIKTFETEDYCFKSDGDKSYSISVTEDSICNAQLTAGIEEVIQKVKYQTPDAINLSIIQYLNKEGCLRFCSHCGKPMQFGFYDDDIMQYSCESCFPLYMDNEYGYNNWMPTSDLETADSNNPACIGEHRYVVRDGVDSSWEPNGWFWTTWYPCKLYKNTI